LQSAAYDFIYSENGEPVIIELSCFFGTKGSSKCSGYWDRNLNFHEKSIEPSEWILRNLLKSDIENVNMQII
jgi:hypothetical protein